MTVNFSLVNKEKFLKNATSLIRIYIKIIMKI